MRIASPLTLSALLLAIGSALVPAAGALAEASKAPAVTMPTETKRFDPEYRETPREAEAAPEAPKSDVERFCSNIADSARDRRYALQTADLAKLQGEIDARMVKLEEKRAEYEAWLKKRNDFAEMAQQNLTEIYSKMKPDAAAERLAELDTMLAASLIMKLDPKFAGLVLNEMNLKKAAVLTGVIAASSRKADPS